VGFRQGFQDGSQKLIGAKNYQCSSRKDSFGFVNQ
jgi:hypothetical protein